MFEAFFIAWLSSGYRKYFDNNLLNYKTKNRFMYIFKQVNLRVRLFFINIHCSHFINNLPLNLYMKQRKRLHLRPQRNIGSYS